MDNAEISKLCDDLWQIPTNFQEEAVILLSSEEETEQDKTWKHKLTQNSKSSPPSSSQIKSENYSQEHEKSPTIVTRECQVTVKKLSQEEIKEALAKSSLNRKQRGSKSDSSESETEMPSIKNNRNTIKKMLKRLKKVVDSESDDENILLKKNDNKDCKNLSSYSEKPSSDAGTNKDKEIQRKKKEKLNNTSEEKKSSKKVGSSSSKKVESSSSKKSSSSNSDKKLKNSSKTSEKKLLKPSKLEEKVSKTSKPEEKQDQISLPSSDRLNNNSDDHECVQTDRGTLKIRRKSISEAASNQMGFKLLQNEKQELSAIGEPASKKQRVKDDPYEYDDSSSTSTPVPFLQRMTRRMTISHANEEFSRSLFRLPVPIIDPKPMPKRRGSTAAKPLPKRRQSTTTASNDPSVDMFAIAANKRVEENRKKFNAPPRRNSVSGMTTEAAEKAKKARQEKLKAITESRNQIRQQQNEQAKDKVIDRAATLPKVKNTVMTRGDFLTSLEPVKPVKKSSVPATRTSGHRSTENDPNFEQLLKQNQESISKFRSDHVQPAIGICNNLAFYERQTSIPVIPPRRLTIEVDVDDIPPQPEDSQVVEAIGVGFYQDSWIGKEVGEAKKAADEIMKAAGELRGKARELQKAAGGLQETAGGLQGTAGESRKSGEFKKSQKLEESQKPGKSENSGETKKAVESLKKAAESLKKAEELHKPAEEPWNAARQVLQDFPHTNLNPIVLSLANPIRVVHQKPLNRNLKPVLKSFSRLSPKFRKSVSFKAVVKEVREFDINDPVCENIAPPKAVAMVQPMNTPSGEEQVLAKILRWEPGFLIDRPEIFQTFPLKVEYESLTEFKKMINPIIEVELLTRMSNEYGKSLSVRENSWHKFIMLNPSYVRGRTRIELDRVQDHQKVKERFNQGSLLVLKIMDTSCNREERFFAYVVQENRQNFRTIVVEAIIDREKIQEYKIVQCRLVAYIRAELKSMMALNNLQETELVRKLLRPLTNLPNLAIENLEAPTIDSNLSEMQTKIVRVVSREMIADAPNLLLIQGGPGTGKTKVIVASILNIFASARKLNKKFSVLICAMSNSCIDEIGTALYPLAKATDIKIVRAGILKPKSEALPFSLNHLAEEMKSHDNRNFLQLKNSVIASADVVLSTVNSSYEVYDTYKKKFDVCFIDEASQLNDAELIIPMHMMMTKMVLVGDENQLQPVVNSHSLSSKRFDVSLFSRTCEVFKDKPLKPILKLAEQFRMQPEIFEFPNRQFYGNSMVNHPSVLSREPTFDLKPYLMLNIATRQALTQDTSAYNLAEVDFVKFFVEVLVRWIPKQLSIGIITPYVRQNNEISQRIQDSERVSVYTIDSAQGLEKDVVLLALTRSDGVGFLNNPKRLNVALTRARRALYIIGNLSSLSVSFEQFQVNFCDSIFISFFKIFIYFCNLFSQFF